MKKHVMAGLTGLVAGLIAFGGEANAHPRRHSPLSQNAVLETPDAVGPGEWIGTGDMIQKGKASYYGYGRLSRYTASGDLFDKYAMTAAHPWLPFGTRVLVRDISTGREVTVTINDRLPTRARVIDLSIGAARELGILQRGLATVSIEHTT
jgi:peptidoglycan lytic transglycosylase